MSILIPRSSLEKTHIEFFSVTVLKEFKNSSDFKKKLTHISEESNKIKRKEINNSLLCEHRLLLLDQQKLALKKQLAKQDTEFNNLKTKLEKEVY